MPDKGLWARYDEMHGHVLMHAVAVGARSKGKGKGKG